MPDHELGHLNSRHRPHLLALFIFITLSGNSLKNSSRIVFSLTGANSGIYFPNVSLSPTGINHFSARFSNNSIDLVKVICNTWYNERISTFLIYKREKVDHFVNCFRIGSSKGVLSFD
jgi:hypothetical protein